MENHSPLRSWVRKHSPIRNKPLPVPPSNAASSEIQQPFREVSGNASPSKRPSRSKLRSLLWQKPQPPTPPGSPSSPHRPKSKDGRRRSLTLLSEPVEQRSSIRKSVRPRQRSTDLRGLSNKISSLEAQLKEARKELDNVSRYASTSQRDTERNESNQTRPERGRRQSHGEAIHYEALVENLLDQRQRHQNLRGSAWDSTADLGITYNEHRPVEPVAEDDDAYFSDAEVRRHKRKRSEVRQTSWERVQSHLQKQQQLLQQNPEPKRHRHSSTGSLDVTSARSKVLPELPDFPFPNKGSPSEFVIQGSADAEETNGCPPLDRHQRAFSQPPAASVDPAQPRAKGHARRRSQIIEPDQLRAAFSKTSGEDPSNKESSTGDSQAGTKASTDSKGSSRSVSHPSPTRRRCQSPSRLDKVEEEFEWDEDIF